MYVLHIDIKMKQGREAPAETCFLGPFKAAISPQPGFRDVRLLRPTEDGPYVLSIAFESKLLQQKWVATDIHTKVWSQMESHFADYSIAVYDTV